MNRRMSVVLTLFVVGALVAPPARAVPLSDTTTLLFQGTAVVCAQPLGFFAGPKPPAPPCPAAMPQGLYLPGQGDGPNIALTEQRVPGLSEKWLQRTGTYAFVSMPVVPATPACTALVPAHSGPIVKPCAIAVAGLLAPVGGIGAACGITHGHGGGGPLMVGTVAYATANVGWISSAGGTIPFDGTYDFAATADPTKDKGATNPKRFGPIVGVLQAQGGSACLKSAVTGKAGASTFTVVGVAALV